MNYSVTISGLVLAAVVPFLAHLGFSDACSGEVAQFFLTTPGLLVAYVGRVRQGDITWYGSKKF